MITLAAAVVRESTTPPASNAAPSKPGRAQLEVARLKDASIANRWRSHRDEVHVEWQGGWRCGREEREQVRARSGEARSWSPELREIPMIACRATTCHPMILHAHPILQSGYARNIQKRCNRQSYTATQKFCMRIPTVKASMPRNGSTLRWGGGRQRDALVRACKTGRASRRSGRSRQDTGTL